MLMNESPLTRHNFGFRLGLLARRWRREVDAAIAVTGLTAATWRPLMHLAHRGDGLHQTTLAASLGIEGSTLVRLLDGLERQRLIERRSDPQDRRAKIIALTAAGHDTVNALRVRIEALESELLTDVDDAELALLGRVFARVDAVLAARRGSAEDEGP